MTQKIIAFFVKIWTMNVNWLFLAKKSTKRTDTQNQKNYKPSNKIF